MTSNLSGDVHSHSGPGETPNEPLPGHEDPMDHEGSTEKNDGLTAQDPVRSMGPGPSINNKVDKASSEDYSCGIQCGGGFIAKHKCVRSIEGQLSITCLGEIKRPWMICVDRQFKTKNGFNRHFRAYHLEGDAILESLVSCPVQGCERVGDRGFTRYDNLLQHRRNIHGENIPKTHVTPRMKVAKPYTRKTANPNRAGPSNESN